MTYNPVKDWFEFVLTSSKMILHKNINKLSGNIAWALINYEMDKNIDILVIQIA